jgi:hypothetical protein
MLLWTLSECGRETIKRRGMADTKGMQTESGPVSCAFPLVGEGAWPRALEWYPDVLWPDLGPFDNVSLEAGEKG